MDGMKPPAYCLMTVSKIIPEKVWEAEQIFNRRVLKKLSRNPGAAPDAAYRIAGGTRQVDLDIHLGQDG